MPINLNPFPFGKVVVDTAGTPVALTDNFSTDTEVVNSAMGYISVAAPDTNTGPLYVGSATMNTSTLVGVIAIIQPATSWSTGQSNTNVIYPRDLYLDADNNGDWALVMGQVN